MNCKMDCKVQEKAIISYIFGDMAHVLPVVPSTKRVKGFTKTIPVSWGKIQELMIRARETLNAFDLLTLLAITRAFVEEEIYDGGTFCDQNGKPIRKMYTLSMSKYRFLKEYRNLNPSTPNKRLVEASFDRLTDCTWQYRYKDGSTLNVKILMDWKVTDDGHYAIWINARYVDKIREKDKAFLRILMNFIYRCKTETGKLLVFWLEGQKGKKYHEDTLISALHLEYTRKRNARQKLKQAFQDALTTGYLSDWNFDNGFFLFSKSKYQVINQSIMFTQK